MGERQEHPGDADLFAWAGGDRAGRDAVGDHVAACDACAGSVAAWALTAETARFDDAPPVPAAARARAVALFAAAPFLAPAPDPFAAVRDAVAGLRRLVADVTFDSWGTLAPGFAGVRGATTAERQLSWVSGGVEVDLQATPLVDGAWALLGQVTVPDGEAVRVVELVPAGGATSAAEVTPDAFGGFDLGATAGAWDLRVRLDDALVVLPGLELGAGPG